MDFLYLLIGIAIGALIAWLFLKGKMAAQAVADPRATELALENATLTAQVKAAAEEKSRLLAEKETERNRSEAQQRSLREASDGQQKVLREELENVLELERSKVGVLSEQLARRDAEMRALEQRLQEQKAELENLQQQFTKEFENLANKIFEEKSKKFTEQNKTQLDDLLKPLGEKIKDFEKKVNDVYISETAERATLKEQLVQLHSLNQQMSKDAQNLTRALKGENKSQGNWGEIILESILEKSGLRKDHEYRAQESFTSETGRRFQPDIVINLPEDKHLVVDSKVSLVAYERFIVSETDEERVLALKEHVASVRKHIKDLSEKNYQKIYELHTLDFVLLFMPIEPAFSSVLQADQELFNDAFEKNIVIVSPSTLLATLRTVANIWRQELQNRNVFKIADEAAAMYDKFVGFTDAMIDVGKKMDDSKKSYETAMGRLSTGSGNVVRRIENLKKLGLKVSKSIDPKLVERSLDEETEEGKAENEK